MDDTRARNAILESCTAYENVALNMLDIPFGAAK